jgi:hypothetical protein
VRSEQDTQTAPSPPEYIWLAVPGAWRRLSIVFGAVCPVYWNMGTLIDQEMGRACTVWSESQTCVPAHTAAQPLTPRAARGQTDRPTDIPTGRQIDRQGEGDRQGQGEGEGGRSEKLCRRRRYVCGALLQAASLPGFLLGGWLVDKTGRHRLVVVSSKRLLDGSQWLQFTSECQRL